MSRIYSILLGFGAFVIAIDQWTKNMILDTFSREGETRSVLSWFSLTLVHNHGAAFGMFRDVPDSIRTAFFILLPLTVLGLLWWTYVRKFKAHERLAPIAMGLVLGGALGNLIDRLRHGYVIDFIDWFYPESGSCVPLFHHFTPITCHWPVFNIADTAITLAMAILMVDSFRRKPGAA